MKRMFLVLLTLLTTTFATDYLVLVDLDKQRLDPIFEKELTIIAELENSAILLVNDNAFDRLTGLSHTIVDQDPQPNEYYLVYHRDERIDLSDYALERCDMTTGKPSVIIAKTTKGKGISFMEGNKFSRKAPDDGELQRALSELT